MVRPEVEEAETEVVAVVTAAARLTEEAIAGGLPTEEATVVGLPIVAAGAIVVAALIVDPLRAGGVVVTEGMLLSFSANLRQSIPTPAHRRSSSPASVAHGPGPIGPHAQGMVPRESRWRCGPIFSRLNSPRTIFSNMS